MICVHHFLIKQLPRTWWHLTQIATVSIIKKILMFLFNCIGLVVLRKHFTKLCHCLPQDYNKTLCRIEENTTVPDGLVPQLEKLPTVELANCHILAAMIVPIQDEVQLVAFCDFVKDLVEGAESKEFVEKLRDGKITSFHSFKCC